MLAITPTHGRLSERLNITERAILTAYLGRDPLYSCICLHVALNLHPSWLCRDQALCDLQMVLRKRSYFAMLKAHVDASSGHSWLHGTPLANYCARGGEASSQHSCGIQNLVNCLRGKIGMNNSHPVRGKHQHDLHCRPEVIRQQAKFCLWYDGRQSGEVYWSHPRRRSGLQGGRRNAPSTHKRTRGSLG